MENVKIIDLSPDCLEAMDTISRKAIYDKLSGGPKSTKITITDHDSGKNLGVYHNKVVITGSMFSATSIFGIPTPVVLPDYNRELSLDNTLNYNEVEPKNTPIVCLFCIGDSGCGTTPKDVFTTNYIDRISPEGDIIPFRYVDTNADLNDDLRRYYFGRKTLEEEGKIAYYFKAFDTTPQMHLRYTDGTQINDELYNVSTLQAAECYVETRLRITRTDFRDYFEATNSWDKAKVSTLSLCSAWYDDTIDDYRYYQQIYPYSKLNFSTEWLVDLTKGIDFNYQIFY